MHKKHLDWKTLREFLLALFPLTLNVESIMLWYIIFQKGGIKEIASTIYHNGEDK